MWPAALGTWVEYGSTEPLPVQSSISSPTALDHICPAGLCSVVLWTADASSVPHGDGEHKLDSGALWPSVLMDVGIEFGGKSQHCGMRRCAFARG